MACSVNLEFVFDSPAIHGRENPLAAARARAGRSHKGAPRFPGAEAPGYRKTRLSVKLFG